MFTPYIYSNIAPSDLKRVNFVNIGMFHQLVVKASEDCGQANMVEVFALNDCVDQNDILHQTNLPLDSTPMISSTDFNTIWSKLYGQIVYVTFLVTVLVMQSQRSLDS